MKIFKALTVMLVLAMAGHAWGKVIRTQDVIGIHTVVVAAKYDNNHTSQKAIDKALSDIGSSPMILLLTAGDWPVTATFPANIVVAMDPGAKFTDSGTVVIQGGLEAGLYQIFNFSGGGQVKLGNQIPQVHPEWYGALPDGSTNSGAAIQAACTTLNANSTGYKNVEFAPGTYIINTGQLLFAHSGYISGQIIRGAGCGQAYVVRQGHDYATPDNWSNGTILQFNDTTIDACVKVDSVDAYSVGWNFGHLAIVGPGKSVGTNIHGVWLTNSSHTIPGVNSLHGSLFEDLCVSNVSGTGFYALKLWDSIFSRIYAAHCGAHGFFIPANEFLGGSEYSFDIDGVALWIHRGFWPVISSFNCSNVGTGLKFGSDLIDKRNENLPDWFFEPSRVAHRVFPIIHSANLEPITTAGIVFRAYSNLVWGGVISIYADSGVTIAKGIEWNSPVRTGFMVYLPHFYGKGTFVYRYYNDHNPAFTTSAKVLIACSTYEWQTEVEPYIEGDQTEIFMPVSNQDDLKQLWVSASGQ